MLSALPLAQLKTRLKGRLRVQAPDGGSYFFRFYRPQNLLGMMPALTPSQCLAFFRDIDVFVTEDTGHESLRTLRINAEGVLKDRRVLLTTEGSAT